MNKKLFSYVLIAFFLTAFSAQAQKKIFHSFELAAGFGFAKGPIFTVYPQYVLKTEVGSGFILGAGTAIRISMPCYSYSTNNNGEVDKYHSIELDVPLFFRVGYGKDQYYFNLDAGYTIGTVAAMPGAIPIFFNSPHYEGFFFEPQFGWKTGGRNSFALGLLLQQNLVQSTYVLLEEGSYTSTTEYEKVFTPAITLRYVFY